MSMTAVTLSFDVAPNTTLLFPRALLPKPNTLPSGVTVPSMLATLRVDRVDAQHLSRYRALCGFAHDGTLPPTYPHVLAAPLHLALLTHRAFPLRLLGAVHVRNTIQQTRALRVDEALQLAVRVEGQAITDSGTEVELCSDVTAGAEKVWQGRSTMLIRGGGKKESKPYVPPDFSSWRPVATIQAAENTGRRYGVVAADLNPIHVHALTARAFGFPRAIAHGMWSFARCVAELQRATVVEACTLEVAFKRPLLLPATAHLVANGDDMALHDGVVKTVYLTGSVKR